MGYPGAYLIDPEAPGFLNCVSRCVRRSLTLRRLSVSGLNFDRRRDWIEQRLIALAQRFAVGLYAGSVMRYQVNLVLYLDPGTARHFSDEEVVRCWASLSQTRWAHGGRDAHAGAEIFKDPG